MNIEYNRVGEVTHITANGTPKEMAGFVLELQNRREIRIPIRNVGKPSREDRRKLVDAIQAVLEGQIQDKHSGQPPDPTSPEPKQDEESLRE